MGKYVKSVLFLLYFIKKIKMDVDNFVSVADPPASSFVLWPNATIPFYVVPEHFDQEQSTSIMTAMALFAFKTCLKFVPVLAPPDAGQHVLVFANPEGVRKCVLNTEGHSFDEPHTVILGYECLTSPHIDMVLMKELGFPFEHNRASRDIYVDVMFENIEPGYVELFTKVGKLPLEMRNLPYDVDSVMHFGEREYSKNGHRTIIFKDTSKNPVTQNRKGLSNLDLRKIDLIYGPECRKRDRQEKMELCQNYPGVARRKREAVTVVNLRVNREITPPPHEPFGNLKDASGTFNDSLKNLGIENEVQEVVDLVYKVSSKALRNARVKYCNASKPHLRAAEENTPKNTTKNKPDVLGIIQAIADYAQKIVAVATANLTEFCAESENIDAYQLVRSRCPFFNAHDCPQTYRSTKSGRVKASTQHRPVYIMSTNNDGNPFHHVEYGRAGNQTEGGANGTTPGSRRKREAESTTEALKSNKNVLKANETNNEGNKTKAQARRDDDDVTRVISVRSKDDSTTESQRRNEASVRTDVTVKETVSQNTTEPDQNKNETTDKVAVKGPHKRANIRGELRTATEIPGQKFIAFVSEWPFPERNKDKPHRRSNKLRKKARKMEKLMKWVHLDVSSEKRKREAQEQMVSIEEEEKSESENEVAKKKRGRQKKLRHSPRKLRTRPTTPNDSVEETTKRATKRSDFVMDLLKDVPEIPPRTVALSNANKEFYSERMWPDGVVKYVLTEYPGHDMAMVRERLAEVNDILKGQTCTKLVEVTEAETSKLTDYLVVDTGADYVTGRVGGRQAFGSLELYKGGQARQHTAMVAMAMLGFYFELARHDRDKYVRVHLRHVRPDKLHHFEKIREDATFPLPYDYASATHPAWQYWRQLGRKGISTVATFKSKDPDGSIMKNFGQHDKLFSDLDLVKINSVYGTKCFKKLVRSKNQRKRRVRKQ